jgi:hypothetical protein
VPDGAGSDVVIGADRLDDLTEHFDGAEGELSDRLSAFPRFVERTDLSRFLVRYEIFKRVLGVQGSVIECGVLFGSGLFAFAQFSALLEPLNHRRQIIGFDTFTGFPSVAPVDRSGGSVRLHEGGYRGAARADLERSVAFYDANRALGHLPKVQLIEGDFVETGPRYVQDNPHLIVAMLYLDFDLLEPTAEAIRLFLPRMPAGAVVAFDESNVAEAPGETQAIVDTVGIRGLRLERATTSSIAWAVLTGDERV